MHGEFRYRRVQKTIVSRIRVGLDRSGQATTQRASSRGLALAKRGLQVKDVNAWRPDGTTAPMNSALHVPTRISCHLTEPPKGAVHLIRRVPLKVYYVFIMGLEEKSQNRHTTDKLEGRVAELGAASESV
jgi:hypothetical protein